MIKENLKYKGVNTIIGENVNIGSNVILMNNCIIEDGVEIGSCSYIDNNSIIRRNTVIGCNSYIGANCIIGEYYGLFQNNHFEINQALSISSNAMIRSGTIVYAGSKIDKNFQTGHHVTIREKTKIGRNVSIGTLSDIQGYCEIGNYVRLHSNVHIGMASKIDGYNWIYPYVCLTNDPTPPSEVELGVHICVFAIIATGSIVLPGIKIGRDSLIGAGSIVTKNVCEYEVAVGNPAKVVSDVRNIKNRETGEPNYPWCERFDRAMPWNEIGYEKWYSSLTDKERIEYGVIW